MLSSTYMQKNYTKCAEVLPQTLPQMVTLQFFSICQMQLFLLLLKLKYRNLKNMPTIYCKVFEIST